LQMDGSAVFNFVQKEVPTLIEEVLNNAGASKDSVDYFLCHQPNRFMLEKLADKMQVPYAKMPNNVVGRYGNSSGATIPIAIIMNLADLAKNGGGLVCLAGFGVGMTWSAMLMRLGGLTFCEMIDYT
jgi:3-oxoacyl-[acyl-carrier-protein] synthase-3